MKKKALSLMLCTALAMSVLCVPGATEAKKAKPRLNKKKVTITAGKSVQLKVKGTKKKVKWSSNKKKIATVSKKGKVKAKKQGTAKITAKVGKKKLVCKVTVKKKLPKNVPPLKESGDPVFGKMGTCINLSQLQDAKILEHVKKHYSSITLENEMKPEAILQTSNKKLIKTEEAKAKTADYVIPDSYKESEIPALYFEKVDAVLKIAKANGLKMRAHTLVWHSQTPDWFFRKDYDPKGNYVTKDQMDARMEMYIRSVMNHVYTLDGGAYKDVVYSWDVVNEYLNSAPSGFWAGVYGGRGTLKNEPPYVKKAFEIAYDVLKGLSLTGTVSLAYNDYNTYINRDNIIALVNYINKDEPEKICSTIGMQSHLDVDFPTPETYVQTLRDFAGAGYEVQITEFDATINNSSGMYRNEKQDFYTQSDYITKLIKGIADMQKQTNVIKSFTLWGLYDEVSWRGGANSAGNSQPLLFDKNINDPKPSFFAFVDALK